MTVCKDFSIGVFKATGKICHAILGRVLVPLFSFGEWLGSHIISGPFCN